MSDLKSRIDAIVREADDWGPETMHQVRLEIDLGLTPTERLQWVEEMQQLFLTLHERRPSDGEQS